MLKGMGTMFFRSSLVGLALVLLGATALYAGTSVNVNATQARTLIRENPDLYILDVRTPQEFFQVRLEGARLIPIDQLQQRVTELPRTQPILVYCAVGSRSSAVANYLSRLGFEEIYNLYGGISAWQVRKYPVVMGPG